MRLHAWRPRFLTSLFALTMLLPAAKALHEQGHEIEWLCGMQVKPLLELYPWIRTIVVDESSLLRGKVPARARVLLSCWRRLKGRHYDLVATCYYDRRYRLLTKVARAERVLTFSSDDRQRRILSGRSHSDEYARILLGWNDDVRARAMAPVRPAVIAPSSLKPDGSKFRIVLVPGGARNLVREDVLRRWPIANFVAVARSLLNSGCEVALSGGVGDSWASEAFQGLPVTDCIGQHTLAETISLFHSSEVVVTPDTGPLHLAGITGASVVGIFGPTSPYSFLPQRAGVVGMWGGEGFACRPCYDGKDYAPCHNNLCIQQVTPQMVVAEVMRLVEERRMHVISGPRIVVPQSSLVR